MDKGERREISVLLINGILAMNPDLFNSCSQLSTSVAHSDCTILGVEPIALEMTEDRATEFKRYLFSHLWLCLWWILQRSESHSNSCLSLVKKLSAGEFLVDPMSY
jgi:hypothetical protein